MDLDDRETFNSRPRLIKVSLFHLYLNLITQIHAEKITFTEHFDIDPNLEQDNVIFLMSGTDQNLNYLLDKRQLEMNAAFLKIEESKTGIKHTLVGFTIAIILILIIASFLLNLYLRRQEKIKKEIGISANT